MVTDPSPDGWSVDYRISGDIPDADLLDIAKGKCVYHAAGLGVPVEEMHAWFKWDDYMDPLHDYLIIGWRSDWKEVCKNVCDLHKA